MRLKTRWWVAHTFVLAALVGPLPAAAQTDEDAEPAKQKLQRHHVGFQLGWFNPSTEVIELGNLDFRLKESDGQTVVRYRYSLNPRLDLVAELRYWTGRGPTSMSHDGKISGGFMGPGVRIHGSQERRIVPYAQGNVYYAQEMLGEPKVLYKHGIGFGISGGVNVSVSRLISIPVEVAYLRNIGFDLDDLSGFGLSAGVNFNF